MARKTKSPKNKKTTEPTPRQRASDGRRQKETAPAERMSNKEYEAALRDLHVELVRLQEWVKHGGLKVCIVFEGRDGAGKGGTIKAITERVSPRVFRVVALPAPTEREKIADVPAALHSAPSGGGRDRDLRSQLVQPRGRRARDGILHRGAGEALPRRSRRVEKAIVDSGVILLKYWLEVSPDEQTRRLEERIKDGRKIWKLSPMDIKSYNRWFDYSRARDEMFQATDSSWAPWFVVRSDDKRRARLNVIKHVLGRIPYKSAPREKMKLPKRQKWGDYRESNYPFKFIPEAY